MGKWLHRKEINNTWRMMVITKLHNYSKVAALILRTTVADMHFRQSHSPLHHGAIQTFISTHG